MSLIDFFESNFKAMKFKDLHSKLAKVLFSLLIIMFSSCTTKYYIVRHAEKLNNTDTSSLTTQGIQRANDLKALLINKNIGKIYASKYKRTQLTAKPIADELNKQMIIYSPDTTSLLAEQLKRISGSNVLIVGHTNNIPELVEMLSDDSVNPIPEDDFDNIFIIEVTKNPGWTSRYLSGSTYGSPSP